MILFLLFFVCLFYLSNQPLHTCPIFLPLGFTLLRIHIHTCFYTPFYTELSGKSLPYIHFSTYFTKRSDKRIFLYILLDIFLSIRSCLYICLYLPVYTSTLLSVMFSMLILFFLIGFFLFQPSCLYPHSVC